MGFEALVVLPLATPAGRADVSDDHGHSYAFDVTAAGR
jgi:hypothetical protein